MSIFDDHEFGSVAIRPSQRAIVVSGFSAMERGCQTQATGAGSCVCKPCILEKIGLAVRRDLDREER